MGTKFERVSHLLLNHLTADMDLLEMVPVEILLNFGNYFHTSQLGFKKISFKNCVSSSLSTQYRAFLFKDPFDFTKA